MRKKIGNWATLLMGLVMFVFQLHKYNTNTLNPLLKVEIFVFIASVILILVPSYFLIQALKDIINKKINK